MFNSSIVKLKPMFPMELRPFERIPFCLLRHSVIDELYSNNRYFITTTNTHIQNYSLFFISSAFII